MNLMLTIRRWPIPNEDFSPFSDAGVSKIGTTHQLGENVGQFKVFTSDRVKASIRRFSTIA